MIELSSIPPISTLFASTGITAPKAAKACNPALLEQVSLWQGDITKIQVDVIVNAANRRLLGGGGVDGAIHRAAGPDLKVECRTLRGANTGESKMTKGYNLPCAHVIHTVGPVYPSSNSDSSSDESSTSTISNRSEKERSAELLSSCYRGSLALASQHSLTSINPPACTRAHPQAFPSISTGVYGYPITAATHIALGEARAFLESPAGENFNRVIFVVFSNDDLEVYLSILPLYFPPAAPSSLASDSAALST